MTFVVVSVSNNQEKVIGTIWAEGEPQARLIASNLCCEGQPSKDVVVRRSEERELPLKLMN